MIEMQTLLNVVEGIVVVGLFICLGVMIATDRQSGSE